MAALPWPPPQPPPEPGSGHGKRGCGPLVADMKRLFERARSEEQKGERESTDCEVVVAEQRFYAHACILSARSGFFEKALSQQMLEGRRRVVELRHVLGKVPRQSVEALLLFMYTGSAEGVCGLEAAWGVCDLLGADSGDFLELSDCEHLRDVCTDVIMGEVKQEDLLESLYRARSLGHSTKQLRRHLLENLVWDVGDISSVPEASAEGGGEPTDLFCELLDVVKRCTAKKPNWLPSRTIQSDVMREPWALTGSSFLGALENTVDSLRDRDLSTGAGTLNQVGAFLAFEFAKPVTVRVVELGASKRSWSRDSLDGADLQCGDSPDFWRSVIRICVPSPGQIHRLPLPEQTTARYWRITYVDGQAHNIAVAYVNFE